MRMITKKNLRRFCAERGFGDLAIPGAWLLVAFKNEAETSIKKETNTLL